jgi:hypothetical protein
VARRSGLPALLPPHADEHRRCPAPRWPSPVCREGEGVCNRSMRAAAAGMSTPPGTGWSPVCLITADALGRPVNLGTWEADPHRRHDHLGPLGPAGGTGCGRPGAPRSLGRRPEGRRVGGEGTPIPPLLEAALVRWVVNAQPLQAVPERQTAVQDAEWSADQLRHGLWRRRCIPPRRRCIPPRRRCIPPRRPRDLRAVTRG